jgi:FKBP-type peptidyl-prolyl cis-trans isomerase FklB
MSETPVNMKTVSYIIGYEVGKSFKAQNIDLNVSQLTKGVNHGLQGKTSVIGQESSRVVMKNFQQTVIEKMQSKREHINRQNLKKSNLFISSVKKAKGIIKANDGVYYKILTKGDGRLPSKTDIITAEYTGTIPTEISNRSGGEQPKLEGNELPGRIFDSSKTRGKPLTSRLNKVIPCWTEALTQVPIGSEIILYCSPQKAYGEIAPPQIGPNQALSFKVKLVDAKVVKGKI